MESSLSLRIASIFILLIASTIGVTLPMITSKSILNDRVMLNVKSLSAGVIVGLALIHLLAEAAEEIHENYHDYHALSYALCGLGIFVTVSVEQIAISLVTSRRKGKSPQNCSSVIESRDIESYGHVHDHSHECDHSHDHTHIHGECTEDHDQAKSPAVTQNCNHTHSHKTLSSHHDHATLAFNDILEATSVKDMVMAYALEFSTAVHSIIIGVNLGLMSQDDYNTIAIMVAVISFHQFVEGFSLGAILRFSKDNLGSTKVIIFMIFFCLTVSVGVAIGIGISEGEGEESTNQILVKSSFSCIAAGAMLYTALGEILPSCFEGHHCEDKITIKLQLLGSFLLGFIIMCIIGIWA